MSERDCGCATRTVPCACGGSLTATPARGIEVRVREHNETAEHRRWRTMGGCWPRGIDVRRVAMANALLAERFGFAA